MKATLATDSDKFRWDSYTGRFPAVPPLNNYAWKGVLEESYGAKTFFFMAQDEKNDICGVLPVYVTKDLRGKKRLYSLKFGFLADDKNAAHALLSNLKDFCREAGVDSNLVTSGYRSLDVNFDRIVKKTVIMDLAADELTMWKSLRDKTRNMIRKAVKSKLVAERGVHNLKEFYDIYTANLLNKGMPVHSYRFFKSLHDRMSDKTELIVAKSPKGIIGGTLIFFSKDAAIYPYQASLTDARTFAPNDFLIWETMKLCLEKGIHKLDMGESTEGGSVYLFKVNFGGSPSDVFYYSVEGLPLKKRPYAKNASRLSLTNRILSGSPYWLRRRMGLWVKARGRII